MTTATLTKRPMAILALAALVAAGGCARKPPKDLPPPPPTTSDAGTTAPTGPTGADTGGAATPGSRADFIAQSGSDRVLFATDSIDLDSDARATLDAQAAWLTRYPRVNATVEGHADERGTREYNLALGDRRANAAKNYLVGKGIDAGRLSTISYGKERPAAEGSDEASWAQNRRAVTVVPEV
jgi:peptidoglycan-associated lipoprotein